MHVSNHLQASVMVQKGGRTPFRLQAMGTMNSDMLSRQDSMKQEAPLEVMSHMGIEDFESEQKDSSNCNPGDDQNSKIELEQHLEQPIGDVISEDCFNEEPFENSSISVDSSPEKIEGPQF